MKVGNIGINNTYNSFSKNNTNENASKTEIKGRNEYHGKEAQMDEMAKEKYSKLYNQTKHMSEKERDEYIHKRYFDSSAPHYIQGMTKKERGSCWDAERWYDRAGEYVSCPLYDPMFRGITINGLVENEKQKLHDRNMINQQIQNILDKNNIIIPQGQRLIFSVDPLNYRITVEMPEDEKTKTLIEAVLNEENYTTIFHEHYKMIHHIRQKKYMRNIY